MKRTLIILALFVPVNLANANPILNTTWQTDDGSAHIKIYACNNGSPCGKIVWVNPNSESMIDRNNPKALLKKRNLVGVPILWGFSKNRNRWSNGNIYNPKNGKTYKSHISLQTNGILKVQGCVGPFCQSQKWTKVK